MSYSYERVERRRRTTGGGGSFGASGSRSAFGYWIPLALTVTAATVGLVAWIWSERRDDEEDSSEEGHPPSGMPPPGYANMGGGLPPGPGPTGFQGPQPGSMGPPSQGGFQGPPPGGFQEPPSGFAGGPPPAGFQGPPPGSFQGTAPGPGAGFTARSTGVERETQQDNTFLDRVSGVVKRAPSPANSYDWASGKMAAGMAAAGAMIGGALGSIGEGTHDNYEDHERWSEEAENRDSGKEIKQGIKRQGTAHEFFSGEVELPKPAVLRQNKRKSVAIVVSAVEHDADGVDEVGHHASILSHLPEHVDLLSTKIFILIYAPDMKVHPLSPVATRRQSASMASSFSNISPGEAHTPGATAGDFPSGSDGMFANVEPNPIDETSPLYKTLHNQSQALVERDNMIMPFTSRTGHIHMLRSLAPETVYIQESMCGNDGDIVAKLSGWVKETIVVIGDEGGHGGLVDTDDEMASSHAKGNLWWQREERTGLGKRVFVVESLKVGDDWRRRVSQHD